MPSSTKKSLENILFSPCLCPTKFVRTKRNVRKKLCNWAPWNSREFLNKHFFKLSLSLMSSSWRLENYMFLYSLIAGFGDAVDNSNCWDPVISYVESQYESFLDAETRVHRVQMPDSRVHACLYFIAPSGHGLKPLDVEFMKRLHDKVSKFFKKRWRQTGFA